MAASEVPARRPGPRLTVTETPTAEAPFSWGQTQSAPPGPAWQAPAPPAAMTVVPAGAEMARCTSQPGARAGSSTETRYV